MRNKFNIKQRLITLIAVVMITPHFLMGCSESTQPKSVSTGKAQDLTQAPVHLKVGEGFINPLGYYEQRPRFTWQLSEKSSALSQTAYQIQVTNSHPLSSSFLQWEEPLWDSKKVISNQNAWVQYQGPKLQSRQKIYWRVKIWDEQQRESNWSEINHLELGLVDNDDWQAQWIGHPDSHETDENSVYNRTVKGGNFPVPNNLYYRPQYLRNQFTLANDIQQARLYISAKGVFKPYINGVPVSADAMTPGWTPYHKRIETLTYDVTSQLQPGENAIGAILAEGWHSGRIFHPTKQQHILPMRLLAQLEVTYQDGSRQTISTNNSWQSTDQGPIREASNYDGERYDANYEQKNWHTANFTPENWQTVLAEPIDNQVALKPKRHKTVRTALTLPAVSIVSEKDGVVIYDMGQNMVGVPAINIPVIANQTVTLRFAEALNNTDFAVQNLRSAKNIDYYIPNQTGTIQYQPSFTFHGYRYVELSGYDTRQKPRLDWLTGQVLHSDFTVYDNFNSDNALLNQLSSNVSWGLRGNFLDIPTDCPQRDERLGWTGDAQVFAQTSMYKADVYGFWAAWLQSVREDQGIDGLIPNYVPFRSFLASHTGAAWGDAGTIVPWELYQFTGDKNVLAENYTMMKQWLAYHTHHSYQFVSTMSSHGDWLQPFTQSGANGGDTHRDLIATAYFAHSANIMAKSARILGYTSDAAQFETLFKNIKQKFRHYFFDANLDLHSEITKPPLYKNGSEKKGKTVKFSPKTTQTTYLLPLAFELFDEKDKTPAVEKLVTLIEQSNRHLKTGFLGTPLLAPVLQQYGHSELMYDILFKETYPSWFYSINNGATTTWERWDSYSLEKGFNGEKMNSLNHYAYGAVASWFYRGMLGIQPLTPGFKQFEVAPQFSHKLSRVKGSHPTPQGDIAVSWQLTKAESQAALNIQLTMHLTVPKNSQAVLTLPHISQLTILYNDQPLVHNNKALAPGEYKITGFMNK
ncbi:alpha-L-rhamnosidase [Algibacillus agarilyticus]|uniref:alpha-L-rhamnosidase n=1 Tax=Algibacillus agarilyticus TaxID=2234133 RepID=UPI000DCFB639|nr:alpha-L-rhamnosidase [Algibacillus agarilyticus]